MRPFLALALGALLGCVGRAPTVDVGSAPRADSTEDLPYETVPCARLDAWPFALDSSAHDVVVRYRKQDEAAMAASILTMLDADFDVETTALGFSPPLPDALPDGTFACGDDARFDVFLWRGHEECYVDVTAPIDATATDDEMAYLVIDPWGPFGGDLLAGTTAHELNHAMQAADDWSDAAIIYEMTSTFMEEAVAHDRAWWTLLVDLQSHPDWSLDRNDGYATWYMYAAALYLFYVERAFFDDDPRFVAAMWHGLQGPADYEGALDALLRARGSSFEESVLGFARWRTFVGARDDGAHFLDGDLMPADAAVLAVDIAPGATVTVTPMLLGTAYLRPAASGTLDVDTAALPAGARLVVQLIPGDAADGDTLVLPAPVATDGTRLLALTVLPPAGEGPLQRTDAVVALPVTLAP